VRGERPRPRPSRHVQVPNSTPPFALHPLTVAAARAFPACEAEVDFPSACHLLKITGESCQTVSLQHTGICTGPRPHIYQPRLGFSIQHHGMFARLRGSLTCRGWRRLYPSRRDIFVSSLDGDSESESLAVWRAVIATDNVPVPWLHEWKRLGHR